MEKHKEKDLLGKYCPYPIMYIIDEVDRMSPDERILFFVDDPLAIKAVEEELEDYPDISVKIEKKDKYWIIDVYMKKGG